MVRAYTNRQTWRASARADRIQQLMRRYRVSAAEAARVVDDELGQARRRVESNRLAPVVRRLHAVSGQMAHNRMLRDTRERGTIPRELYMRNYNTYKNQFFQELCRTNNIPMHLRN